MKISEIKDYIKKEIKVILSQIKNIFNKNNIIFISIIILLGLVIHFELISRDVSNPDTTLSGYHYISGGWEVSLGRWFNVIISKLRFGISTPLYSTVISLSIMAVTILFIIDLLELKNKISKILCAILLITIPAFAVTLTYFYCSDIYQIAMLTAVLAPWCVYKIKNKKIGILLGAICIAISMGSYQSYLGVSCGLCIIVWILRLINNKNYKIKDLGRDILKIIISIIIGMILYAIISKIFLFLYSVDVASYSGANNISIINTIKNLPKSLKETYHTFFALFFENDIVKNSPYHRQILYLMILILIFVALIFNLIKDKNYTNSVLAIILTLLLPIAFNIIILIAPERQMSTLMTTAMFFIILYLIALLDCCKIQLEKVFAYFVIIITIYTYILTINATYIAIDLTKKQTIETAGRILERIESIDDYNENMEICIVGIISDENFPREDSIYDMSIGFVSDFGYFWNDRYDIEISGWKRLYQTYFGYNINLCEDEKYSYIVQTDEFKQMSLYPNENSVKVIDNVVVIKLTNEPYLQVTN